MITKGVICGLVALLVAVGNPTTSFAAVQFTVTDLGTLGGASSSARGINAGGQVVGWADTAAGLAHAFLYSGGVMIDLGTFGGKYSAGNAINDAGHVTGYARTLEEVARPYVYANGVMSDPGYPSGSATAHAINAASQIAGTNSSEGFVVTADGNGTLFPQMGGYFTTISGINDGGQVVGTMGGRAFRWTAGTALDLGTLGGTGSGANAINARGDVVGHALTAGNTAVHAFLYSDGVMTDLGTLPGSSRSSANAINSLGKVVGTSTMPVGFGHAFLYSEGVMIDLNTLIPPDSGWTLVTAQAINDRGQIAGQGLNPAGQTHAFLLTPIPEPCILSLVGLTLFDRRRRGITSCRTWRVPDEAKRGGWW